MILFSNYLANAEVFQNDVVEQKKIVQKGRIQCLSTCKIFLNEVPFQLVHPDVNWKLAFFRNDFVNQTLMFLLHFLRLFGKLLFA